jgi:ubiquinone/menaquinone biosynthesis C-methylase UbiE
MSLNSYISRQFSNPAGIGVRIISFVMNWQNRPMYDETIRLLTLSESDNVLDIGCGNGYVLNLLAMQSRSSFTGIDPSESIIREAARRYREFVNAGRMTFLCQDVSNMAFADGSFSKAYTINTVYFWDDLNGAMIEIRRVLKPGGLFLNTLYTNETLSHFAHTQFGYRRFTVEQLIDAGKGAGFSVKVEPILGGSAYCVLYER